MSVQEREQPVDFETDLRITIEAIDGGERQQHEGVVITVAQRIPDCTIGRQRMDEAGLAIGRPGLAQEIVEPLQRDVAPLGVPAHLRRFGVAIDLTGLNEHPPRCEAIGPAVGTQPVDKTARRCIPTFRRPQRQGLLDHAKLQPGDDIGRRL